MSLVVLGVAFLQVVKTWEQQNFFCACLSRGELRLTQNALSHLLGLVLAGVDCSLNTVSGAHQARGMVFKFITNSEQLWRLNKLFTRFPGITLSASAELHYSREPTS